MPDVIADGHHTFSGIADLMRERYAGTNVQSIFRLAAAMLCCDILAQDTAKAPFTLREKLRGGTTRVVHPEDHPVAAFLDDAPNSRHTWFEFDQMMGYWWAFSSNAYMLIKRDGAGRALGLVPLARGRLEEVIAEDTLFYTVNAMTEWERSLYGFGHARVPERDIVHVRNRMVDGMHGYSTAAAGRDTLDTSQAIEDYRSNLFEDGGQIRGVFRRDAEGALSEEAYKRLKRDLPLMMKQLASGSPVLLEDKIQFQALSVNPAEAELTKQFEAQISALGRLWRIPPHKLFHLAAVKYENVEVLERSYMTDTLLPMCIPFEQRLTRALLSPRDRQRFFVERDRERLAVTDPKSLNERMVKRVETGIISRNEARARLGENPIEGGDTFMIPANMVLVDEKNEIVVGKQDPAAQSPDNAPTEAPAPKPKLVVNND